MQFLRSTAMVFAVLCVLSLAAIAKPEACTGISQSALFIRQCEAVERFGLAIGGEPMSGFERVPARYYGVSGV